MVSLIWSTYNICLLVYLIHFMVWGSVHVYMPFWINQWIVFSPSYILPSLHGMSTVALSTWHCPISVTCRVVIDCWKPLYFDLWLLITHRIKIMFSRTSIKVFIPDEKVCLWSSFLHCGNYNSFSYLNNINSLWPSDTICVIEIGQHWFR